MFLRSWIKQDKGAEGRGRIARHQMRLRTVEIEKMIMQYQSCMDTRQTTARRSMLLWLSVVHSRSSISCSRKTRGNNRGMVMPETGYYRFGQAITPYYAQSDHSRMERVYDCLLLLFRQ